MSIFTVRFFLFESYCKFCFVTLLIGVVSLILILYYSFCVFLAFSTRKSTFFVPFFVSNAWKNLCELLSELEAYKVFDLVIVTFVVRPADAYVLDLVLGYIYDCFFIMLGTAKDFARLRKISGELRNCISSLFFLDIGDLPYRASTFESTRARTRSSSGFLRILDSLEWILYCIDGL